MAWTEFAYAIGHDAAEDDFTLFEETFTYPVLTAPNRVPRGSTTSKATSGHEVTDGWQTLVLQQLGDPFGTTLFADLLTYAQAVWGGLDAEDENADLSLKFKDVDGTYKFYNVLAHLPLLGTDYQHITNDEISDLKLRHTLLNAYTPE